MSAGGAEAQRKRRIRLEIYPTKTRFGRLTGRYSWRAISGNNVNWADPSKAFTRPDDAVRSFRDLVGAVNGSWSLVDVVHVDG